MKKSWFILPFALGLALKAQTNSVTPGTNPEAPAVERSATVQTNSLAPTNAAPERPPTEIFSDSANFDLKTRVAVYIGHVRVVDPQMKMTCSLMTARVPESGKIDSIVAEQNVVIDAIDNEGKPIHATGDKAVYTYSVANSVTNETIELTGNPLPHVQKPGYDLTGVTITWDRVNNTFSATGQQHIVIRPQTNEPDTAPPQTTEKK